MLGNSGLRFRMTATFLVLSIFLALVGGLGFFSLRFMAASYQKAATELLPKNSVVAEMRSIVQGMSRYLTFMANPALPPEGHVKFRKLINERLDTFDKSLAKLETFSLSAQEKELVEEYRMHWAKLKSLIIQGAQWDEGGPANYPKIQALVATDVVTLMEKLNDTAIKSRKAIDEESQAALAETQAAVNRSLFVNTIATVAGILVSLFLAAIFGTNISRHLRSVASSFSEGVDQVRAQATQMAASSEELSAAVSEQASALQSTAVSIQEIGEMVRMNATNSSRSNDLATDSASAAQECQRRLNEMLKAIEQINESNGRGFNRVNESNHQFAKILKIITDIGDKTKVINDIVFQTKLLSFNASVEAARAAEHGKGFAVVAEEVGNLAAMSGSAAREISSMLETGIATINEIIESTRNQLEDLIRDSRSSVEAGVTSAGRCRESLNQLVGDVSELQKMVAQISKASGEQASAVAGINESIRELESFTDLNRTQAAQASTSSIVLKERSESLEASLRVLRETIEGARAADDDFAPAAAFNKTKFEADQFRKAG